LTDRIFVFGGYGVFGGRLARALARWPGTEVIVAGRSLAKGRSFCAEHGGSPLAVDRDAPDLAVQLLRLAPAVVLDAAGPFRVRGTDRLALARAAIAWGPRADVRLGGASASQRADGPAGVTRCGPSGSRSAP
jgi:nucleoside-diphosphate-sugar epimerase